MKVLKRIIIWLLVLLTLLIVVAYILPGSYKVERSILIKGDGATVFSMVCDFNNWEHWTPWDINADPNATQEIIGKCEIGAVHRWNSEDPNLGKGEMIITKMVPQRMLEWDLRFEGFSEKMVIGMTFEPEGKDWVINWTAEGELGYNPLYRYFGLMIDSDLGADYEKGLQQLKDFCESLPDYPGIKVTELSSMPAIVVRDSVAMEDMEAFMGTYFPQLYMYAMRMEASIAGHPYTTYFHWNPEGKTYMEVGIPLQSAIEGEDVIIPGKTPEGKAVKGIYYGNYEDMAVVYEALEKYLTVMGFESQGLAWEVYITDPTQEPDTSKWETHVYFPIK